MADDWENSEALAPADKDLEKNRWADEDVDDEHTLAGDSWDADSDDENKESDKNNKANGAAQPKQPAMSKLSKKKAAQIAEEQRKLAEQKAAAEAKDPSLQRKKKEEIEAMARERDFALSGDLLGLDKDEMKKVEELRKAAEVEQKKALALEKEKQAAAAPAAKPDSSSSSSSSSSSAAAQPAVMVPSTGIENFILRSDEDYDKFAELISKRLNAQGNSGLASQRLCKLIKTITTKCADNMRLDEFAELKRFTTSIHNERTEKLKNKKKGQPAKQAQLKTVKVTAEKVDRNNIGYEAGDQPDFDEGDFM